MPGFKVDQDVLRGLPDAERRVVERELAQVEEAFRANPLLGYRPHVKQQEFHKMPHPPMRAFFGGNRSGKTTATCVDTILQCVDADLIPPHLKSYRRWDGPFYCRFVTPDLTNTLEGVVLQKFREWCPKSQFKGGGFDRAYDKVLRILHFKNGNWIQFFSNDQDLDKFGGAALHRVVYDEEPRADIRRECLMRLIDYGGEEVFGMTPLHGLSWTYDELYEPWENGTLLDGRVTIVDMDDNPHLDETTKLRVLSGLGEEEREARKSGRFVSFAGLIYSGFSVSRHGIPQLTEIPKNVEVFAGIDPGIRHMCAVVFAYLDTDDRMVVFDELTPKGQTISAVCEQIKGVCGRWGVSPRWYVIDPASRNKNNQTGRSDQQEFSDNGIVTIPGQNSVSAGINRVKERLEHDRLLIAANCPELRGEFKRYRWLAQGRGESDQKEAPVKKDDHLLDALRYVVMQRPLVPEAQRTPSHESFKAKLLRESFRNLGRRGKVVNHPSGPGIFT